VEAHLLEENVNFKLSCVVFSLRRCLFLSARLLIDCLFGQYLVRKCLVKHSRGVFAVFFACSVDFF